MTQEQFIKGEIYKLMMFNDSRVKSRELAKIVDEEMAYDFDEIHTKIHIMGHGYNHVFDWTDDRGIISSRKDDE